MPVQPDKFTCNRCDEKDLNANQVERFVLTNEAFDEPGLYVYDTYLCLASVNGCKDAFDKSRAEFNFEQVDESELVDDE